MMSLRNYIEELTGRVAQGQTAGMSVAEMQKRITVASLKSLHANGYLEYLERMSKETHLPLDTIEPWQTGVNTNISEIYANLGRT
jgi:hypothetical protein